MSIKVTSHIKKGVKLRKRILAEIKDIPAHGDIPSGNSYETLETLSEAGLEVESWLETSLDIIKETKPERLQSCEELSRSILGFFDTSSFSVSSFNPKFAYASVSRDLGSIIAILESIKGRKATIGPAGDSIFIVYGHDSELLKAVKEFIEMYTHKETKVLSCEPNQGQTIFEKFLNTSAKCNHAVILMTPDDYCTSGKDDIPKPRARQNVIFEYGYFVG